MCRIDFVIESEHGAWSDAFQLEAFADADQEAEVVGNGFRRTRDGGDFFVFGGFFEAFMERKTVDDGDFVGASGGDGDCLAVGRAGDVPRIGGTEFDIVDQHGVDEFRRCGVDDGEGVGGHPTAFKLRRGKLIAGETVDGVDEFAVWRCGRFTSDGAAVWKFDFGQRLQIRQREWEDGHGDEIAVGGADRHVADDEQLGAIVADGDTMRFAARLNGFDDFGGFDVDRRNRVAETVSDVGDAVADGHGRRRMANGDRLDFAVGRVDEAQLAVGFAAGGQKPFAVIDDGEGAWLEIQ